MKHEISDRALLRIFPDENEMSASYRSLEDHIQHSLAAYSRCWFRSRAIFSDR
jgi:hypothetical protein